MGFWAFVRDILGVWSEVFAPSRPGLGVFGSGFGIRVGRRQCKGQRARDNMTALARHGMLDLGLLLYQYFCEFYLQLVFWRFSSLPDSICGRGFLIKKK